MLSLSDHLQAAGATLTFHYTHPTRSVAMQIALAARLDFTEPSPAKFMRASALFTGYVANGAAVDLTLSGQGAPPQFRAAGVSEINGQALADNCNIVAVVTQFEQTASSVIDFTPVQVSVMTVSLAHRPGGPPVYTHCVKTWPGGRVVSEAEATDTARAKAQLFGIDLSQTLMTVKTDTELR